MGALFLCRNDFNPSTAYGGPPPFTREAKNDVGCDAHIAPPAIVFRIHSTVSYYLSTKNEKAVNFFRFCKKGVDKTAKWI